MDSSVWLFEVAYSNWLLYCLNIDHFNDLKMSVNIWQRKELLLMAALPVVGMLHSITVSAFNESKWCVFETIARDQIAKHLDVGVIWLHETLYKYKWLRVVKGQTQLNNHTAKSSKLPFLRLWRWLNWLTTGLCCYVDTDLQYQIRRLWLQIPVTTDS